jgi:hypothetical protein
MDTARPDAPVTEEHRRLALEIQAEWEIAKTHEEESERFAKAFANVLRDQRENILKEFQYLADVWPLRYYSNPTEREEGRLEGYSRAAQELQIAIDQFKRIAALSAPAEPAKEDQP